MENGSLKVLSLNDQWSPLRVNYRYYPECYVVEGFNGVIYLQRFDSQNRLGAIAKMPNLLFTTTAAHTFSPVSMEPAVTKDSNGKIKAFWWSQDWFTSAPEGCVGYEAKETRPFIPGTPADTGLNGTLFIPDSINGGYLGQPAVEMSVVTYFQSCGFYPEKGGNPWLMAIGNRYDNGVDKLSLDYYEATPGVPYKSISSRTINFSDTTYKKERLITRYRLGFSVNPDPNMSTLKIFDYPSYQFFLLQKNDRNFSLYAITKKELLNGTVTLHTIFENKDPLEAHDELIAGTQVNYSMSISDEGTIYALAIYPDGMEVTSLSSTGRRVIIPSSKKYKTNYNCVLNNIVAWHDRLFILCYTSGYNMDKSSDLIRVFGIGEITTK